MKKAIIIQAPRSRIYEILCDPLCVRHISPSIVYTHFGGLTELSRGTSYWRIFSSHGIPNPQTVSIETSEKDTLLVTKTKLIGYTIISRYTLETR